MKKTAYIILALSALLAGLWACNSKQEPVDPEAAAQAGVDLRYRVNDIYNISAVNPEVITIVVKSTKPWTVRSYNPDWCMIDNESGEAVPDSLVHVGKGENTTVRVQYYDNTGLDDRTDYIEIASDGFVGKKVTVNQKGSAYITVPEDELAFMLPTEASQATFHVSSNQPWSAAITEIDGDWLTITEGASGEKDGVVTVSAQKNTQEMRYATVTLYDRNGFVSAEVHYTQDGVQLEPEDTEIRAEWDAAEVGLVVAANAHWTVTKKTASDTWFTILTPEFTGNGTVRLQLEPNEGTSVRNSVILLKTDDDENGYSVTREILVRQANPIKPVRYDMNPDEIALWKSDKGIDPVYTDGVGALFAASGDKYARLNRTMGAGSYAFNWKDLSADADVRLWFCYSEGQEIKLYFMGDGSLDLSFNAGSAPGADKPAKTSGITSGFDMSVPHTLSVEFKQNDNYCHVIVSMDGNMAYTFDTSATAISHCEWGSSINMYVGVDAGSAVIDWYEYTPLFSWD